MGDLIFIQSLKSENYYILSILKEKHKEEYRISNLTKGHICPCIFSSKKEAVDDILKCEAEGRIKIIRDK